MFGFAETHDKPFIVLTIMFLAWLNYRGVYATLTFNLVITAIAFVAILDPLLRGDAVEQQRSCSTRSC